MSGFIESDNHANGCLTINGTGPRTLMLALVFIFAASCSDRQTEQNSTLGEIARLEDIREPGGIRLSRLALNPDPVIAARAVRALARLQDPAALPAIESALHSNSPDVADEGAFALMTLGLSWDKIAETVRVRAESAARLALETAPVPRRPRLLRALATLAGPDSALLLLNMASDNSAGADAASVAAAAEGLAGFLRDGGSWPGGSPPAPSGAIEVRRARAWLLARAASKSDPSLWTNIAVAALADADSEVRALAARALAAKQACAQPSVAAALDMIASTDENWRPRVESLKALAQSDTCAGNFSHAIGEAAAVSASYAGPLGDQTLLSLKDVSKIPVADIASIDTAIAILENARSSASTLRRVNLARLSCQLALAADKAAGTETRVSICGGSDLPSVERDRFIAQALADSMPSDRDQRLSELIQSTDHLTRLDALDSAAIRGTTSGLIETAMLAALTGNNGPEVATAATSLAAWPLQSAVDPITGALGRFAPDPDPGIPASLLEALSILAIPSTENTMRPFLVSPEPSVRSAAVRAMASLGITASPEPPPLKPADWLDAPLFTGLRVETEKGSFLITLDRDNAPAHANVLTHLADQGYFDGRAFHRVVPDFVIQGGNAGDDGWGGPGFTIRCQVSPVPYTRGTVGMSLMGKDTGGAEFFVSHGSFPHLEGRYTVVGQVTQGMDVVDLILQGDRMLSVRPVL